MAEWTSAPLVPVTVTAEVPIVEELQASVAVADVDGRVILLGVMGPQQPRRHSVSENDSSGEAIESAKVMVAKLAQLDLSRRK